MRLSSKLSPQAKKLVLTRASEDAHALLQLSSVTNEQQLRRALSLLGGEVVSWQDETHLANVQVAAAKLSDVAALPGVVYVELSSPYHV